MMTCDVYNHRVHLGQHVSPSHIFVCSFRLTNIIAALVIVALLSDPEYTQITQTKQNYFAAAWDSNSSWVLRLVSWLCLSCWTSLWGSTWACSCLLP
jgi:hypothetical protein